MPKLFSKTQVKHINKQFGEQFDTHREIVVILQDVDDPINVGSLFRTADAAGIDKLILAGKTPSPPQPGINLTARGLERSVAWEYVESADAAISDYKQQGFQIVAIEITPDAQPYFNFEYADKVCLVLGNEALGVYKKNLALCDASVYLPMLGKGQSLNVSVAGAIVIYQMLTAKA